MKKVWILNFVTAIFLNGLIPVWAQTVYDENTDGDVSGNATAPTWIFPTKGSNRIIGSVTSSTGDTRDYYRFSVPLGLKLLGVNVIRYDDPSTPGIANDGNTGFHAIDEGRTSVIPSAGTSAQLLGGDHIDGTSAGTDALLSFAAAATAGSGFTSLGAGTYTYLIQQTGSHVSEYEIEFVIGVESIDGPGGLIDSFGDSGFATASFPGAYQSIRDIAIQNDGKIVAVGIAAASFNADPDIAVARFLADGTLDSTFSGDGMLTTAIGTNAEANSVAIQDDGKIVVTGSAVIGGEQKLVVVRYTETGALDSTFGDAVGDDGIATLGLAGRELSGNDVEVLPDSRMVVTGTAKSSSGDVLVVARFRSDGRLDSNFATSGLLTLGFGNVRSDSHSLDIQDDGGIVFVGSIKVDVPHPELGQVPDQDFIIFRLLPDGTPDTSFSDDGRLQLNIVQFELDAATHVQVQGDGAILVGGFSEEYNPTFVRLLSDGSLDPAFGNGGISIIPLSNFGFLAKPAEFVQQPNGRILVSGRTGDFRSTMQLNPDGTKNTQYGDEGAAAIDLGMDFPSVLSMLDDGSFVTSGADFVVAKIQGDPAPGISLEDSSNSPIANDSGPIQLHSSDGSAQTFSMIIRNTGSGTLSDLEVSFSAGSASNFSVTNLGSTVLAPNETATLQVTFTPTTENERTASLTITSNALVDSTYTVNFSATGPAGLREPGELISGFGSSGEGSVDFGAARQFLRDIAIQEDDSILAGGDIDNGNGTDGDIALARFLSDGSLDNSFGTAGKVITDISSGDNRGAAVAVQDDNKILVAGFAEIGGDYRFSLIRYTAGGVPDTTFSGDGFADAGISGVDIETGDMILQPDGKIVLVGAGDRFGGDTFEVVRFDSDGSLDAGFGNAGILSILIGGGLNAECHSAAIHDDGSIVILGTAINTTSGNSNKDYFICRCTPDGTLDSSFSGDGKLQIDLVDGGFDEGFQVLVQRDGKILLSGSKNDYDVTVVRLNPDGSFDQGFGEAGIVDLPGDLSGFTAFGKPLGMAQHPNDKILLSLAVFPNLDNGTFQLEPDGSFNTNYGQAGFTPTGLSGTAAPLEILDDGNYIAGREDFSIIKIKGEPGTGVLPPPTLQAIDRSVHENEGVVNVPVTISRIVDSDIVFSFTTVDGSAEASVDYHAVSGQGSITAGQTGTVISVPILQDALFEDPESFLVRISNPSANVSISKPTATIAIHSYPYAPDFESFARIHSISPLPHLNQDSDGDGSTDYAEWALGGTNPRKGGINPKLMIGFREFGGTSYFTLSYLRHIDGEESGGRYYRGALEYQASGSRDLANWSDTPVHVEVPNGLPAAPIGYEWGCVRLPFDTHEAKGFLKVEIDFSSE